MSITARQLFYTSYRDSGQVLLEQTGLNQDQEEECRQAFNRLVDSMRLQRSECSYVQRLTFDLVAATGSYTMGPSGTVAGVTVKPVRVQRASLINTQTTPNAEYPLSELSEQDWQRWRLKDLNITWPSSFYYERTPTNGTLHLLYVPSIANKVAVYLEVPISPLSVASGSPPDYSAVTLNLDAGYEEFLETNLAKVLAAKNPRSTISPLVLAAAAESARRLRISNFRGTKRDSDYPIVEPHYHDGWGNRRF